MQPPAASVSNSRPQHGAGGPPLTPTCTNRKLPQESILLPFETLRWGDSREWRIFQRGCVGRSSDWCLCRGCFPPRSRVTSAVRPRCALWLRKIRPHRRFSKQRVLPSGGGADECPHGAFFRIQVGSAGDEAPYLQSQILENPAAAALETPGGGRIRLISHRVRDVSPGVVGVDLTLGFVGRRFAGGASGQADSAGRTRVPALATLSALGSYIRFASEGVGAPTLALESVSQFSLARHAAGGGGSDDVWAWGATDCFLAVDGRVGPGGCSRDTRSRRPPGHSIVRWGRATARGGAKAG